MSSPAPLSTLPAPTLLESLIPLHDGTDHVSGLHWVRSVLAVMAGSLLLTISAKLEIPFYPVPFTMQTMVVLCLGMVLGARLGSLAVLAYLAQGAAGLPVFAGTPELGIGLAYMVGPTGGYLAGFVLAAFVTGWLASRRWDRHVLGTVGAMIVGNAIIYTLGVLWLGRLIGWEQPVLDLGVKPFLLGDLAKIVIAAALLPTLWRLVGRR